MKRIVDVVVASIGLVLLLPLMAISAVAIVLDSGFPVLFRQTRMGQDFVPFDIFKFRTMTTDSDNATISAEGGHVVTSVGRWLRRTKIDEVPQLANVIAGQMSIVGPRPELPAIVAAFSDDYEVILDVKPGITSPASIEFRNEEAILSSHHDPLEAYVDVVMPQKLELDKHYRTHHSLIVDVRIIFATLRAVFVRA